MYICVLDFEATCWENSLNKNSMEIIEFPSILYKFTDGKIEYVDTYQKYVRPTIYPKLTDFCTGLTGITQKTVDDADTFEKIYHDHFNWVTKLTKDSKVVFLTVGYWDLSTQLPRELRNKKINKYYSVYKQYINIKDDFEKFYKQKAHGMTGMLKFLRLKLDGKHHSGIDDCRNTAKILIQMIEDGYTDFMINTVK